MRRASLGCSSSHITQSASRSGLFGGASSPVAPGTMRSGTPFTAVATTGLAEDNASVRARPSPSYSDEITKTSKVAAMLAASFLKPGKTILIPRR